MTVTSTRNLPYLALASVFALVMMGTTMPTPLYPLYQEVMGFSALVITVIFAAYAVGVITALMVMGNWSDQLGRRPLLVLGLLCALASGVAFLWAQGLAVLLLGRFLSGLSAGIFTATATVAVVELAPSVSRTRAVFAATAANMGGLGAGPMFAGLFAQIFPIPLRLPYAVHSVLIVVALLVVAALPETVRRPAKIRLTFRKPGVPAQVWPVFVPAAVAAFAGFAIMGMFTSVAPALLGELMGQTHGMVVGLVAGSVFFASIAGQSVHEHLPARLRLPLGGMVMIAGALLLMAAIVATSALGLFVSALLSGAGQGLVFRAGMAGVLAASPPGMRAQVAASFFLVAYVAISLPVVGLGLMIGSFSLATAGIVFAAMIAALALTAVMIVWRRQN